MDEGKNEGIPFVQSQFLKYFVDFSRIDGAALILIEDIERVFEFLIVFGSQSFLPIAEVYVRLGDLGLILGCSAHKICMSMPDSNKI